jgi:hypothetical protein
MIQRETDYELQTVRMRELGQLEKQTYDFSLFLPSCFFSKPTSRAEKKGLQRLHRTDI